MRCSEIDNEERCILRYKHMGPHRFSNVIKDIVAPTDRAKKNLLKLGIHLDDKHTAGHDSDDK